MARVLVAPTAWDGLVALIRTHSLPLDTPDRVKRSLQPLARFPQLGREIEAGRWGGFRFILGPWPWLIILYRYDPDRRCRHGRLDRGRASRELFTIKQPLGLSKRPSLIGRRSAHTHRTPAARSPTVTPNIALGQVAEARARTLFVTIDTKCRAKPLYVSPRAYPHRQEVKGSWTRE